MDAMATAPEGALRFVRTLPIATTAAGALVESGQLLLAGFALAETTGTGPATCELFDGTTAGGVSLCVVHLSAGESCREALPHPGILCQSGVYLAVTAGSVRGSAWVRSV